MPDPVLSFLQLVVSALHWKGYRLMQPEAQPSLGRQHEVFLAGESGHRCADSGAYRTADQRSLAACGNGPDEGAAATTAADQGEIAFLMISTVAAEKSDTRARSRTTSTARFPRALTCLDTSRVLAGSYVHR